MEDSPFLLRLYDGSGGSSVPLGVLQKKGSDFAHKYASTMAGAGLTSVDANVMKKSVAKNLGPIIGIGGIAGVGALALGGGGTEKNLSRSVHFENPSSHDVSAHDKYIA